MSTKWTIEQKNAIEFRNCNLLVSAAAGSGKTTVLVQRIIEKVIHPECPVDVDRLLVMTFTNAAASEMRERLGKVLLEKLEESPENAVLQRQYMLLGKASIMTVHSFCLNLIRENFHLLDIDPDFSVGDTNEMKLLLSEAFDEAFDQMIVDGNEDFMELLHAFGGKTGDGVKEIGKKIFSTIQSNPFPKEWLVKSVRKFEEASQMEVDYTFFGKKIKETAKARLEYYHDKIGRLMIEMNDFSEFWPVNDTYSEDKMILLNLLNALEEHWDTTLKAFENVCFSRYKSAKKGADEELKERAKSLRDEYKAAIIEMREQDFVLTVDECKSDFRILARQFSVLSDYINLASELYLAAKKKNKVLDFGDFEHFAIELLIQLDKEPTPLAMAQKEKFEEVLIDEYQDTNLIQEMILKAVSREGDARNLFMVGDVKQSIYRFRHAMPDLFIEKYKDYVEDGQSLDRKILLGKNFRSRSELLGKINHIFERIMSYQLGNVEYCKKEFLNPGAQFEQLTSSEEPFEMNIIDMSDVDMADGDEDEDTRKNAIVEARFIIKRIKELLSSERKPRFSDFVVLMRAANTWAEDFEEQFNLAGIPVFSDVSSNLFETVEIMSVMSLLKALNNPLEDISLISLMRSNFFGFNNNELADIRIVSRYARFFEAVKTASVHDENLIPVDTIQKSKLFVTKYSQWRRRSGIVSISELVWGIFNETGYFTFVGGLPDGLKRQNNLKLLFEYIRIFEKTGMVGLFNLIDYLENVFGNSGDMGEARLIGEEDNVVRIMSIHKSKGLEFPIVFLAGLGKKFNKMDERSAVLVHQREGFGPELVNYQRNIKYQSIAKRALRIVSERDAVSEEMRILYVGLTRAKEKLILVASVKNAHDVVEKIIRDASESVCTETGKLHSVFLLKSPSFIKWSIAALSDLGTPAIKFFNHVDFGVDEKDDANEDANEDSDSNVRMDTRLKIEKWLETKDERLFDEVAESLEWVFQNVETSNVPAKITVTELKKLEESGRFDELAQPLIKQVNTNFNKPTFMKEQSQLSGAETGTAYHKVFFKLDFDNSLTIDAVETQLSEMVMNQLITEVEKSYMDAQKILAFVKSEMGERIRRSKSYYKEKSFLFKTNVGVRSVFSETIVQGVIDLYFITEKDEIVLIDYKSDHINDQDEIRNRYTPQIEYYSKALEQITGRKVSERYLFMVNSGEVIEI